MLCNLKLLLAIISLLVCLQLLESFDLVIIAAVLLVLLQFCILFHPLHKVDIGTILFEETGRQQSHLILRHIL